MITWWGWGASLGALPRAFQVGGEAVLQVTGRNAFQVAAPAFQVAGEEALQVEVVHDAVGAQLAAGWQEEWLTGRPLKILVNLPLEFRWSQRVLKGVWHNIFDFSCFHKSVPPCPVGVSYWCHFEFLGKFVEIFAIDTGDKALFQIFIHSMTLAINLSLVTTTPAVINRR